LHVAANYGRRDVVEILLCSGANIDEKDVRKMFFGREKECLRKYVTVRQRL
jgi:hypothetical protein